MGDAPVPSMAATWPSGLVASETAAAGLLGVLWFASVITGPWGAAAAAARRHLHARTSKWDNAFVRIQK